MILEIPRERDFFMGKAEISKLMQVVPGADMGLMSSAPQKQLGWEKALSPYPVIATPIPTPPRLPERDIPHPDDTATSKLQGFAGQVPLDRVAKELNPRATATICDVLFVAQDQVQTTDRDRLGAPIVIGAIGQVLKDSIKGDRQGTMQIFNTTGTARIADLVKYKANTPNELIFRAWEEGLLALSPRLIDLLAKPKQLFKLHKMGVVGPGMINPKSIAGINWPDLVRGVPQIARSVRGGHRDISMELKLGRHGYHYLSAESTIDEAERAANELDVITRGIPKSIAAGIVGFYLQ